MALRFVSDESIRFVIYMSLHHMFRSAVRVPFGNYILACREEYHRVVMINISSLSCGLWFSELSIRGGWASATFLASARQRYAL